LGAPLPPPDENQPPPFVDVNADGQADIADLIGLVQFLRTVFSQGEGEDEVLLPPSGRP
jgi:hypothetical protein